MIVAEIEVVYDLEEFLSAGEHPLSQQCHDGFKVLLVQSQGPDVRLISQIDMCFIDYISAMSFRYRWWFCFNIVTVSECPVGNKKMIGWINRIIKNESLTTHDIY